MSAPFDILRATRQRSRYQRSLDTLEASYYRQCDALAAKLRRHLVPLFRKHKLSFVSGNGTWCVSDERGETIHPEPAALVPRHLRTLFAALDSATVTGLPLGSFVKDWSPRARSAS